MAYTPEQQKVINAILAIGRKRGEGPMSKKAALEIGAVESNYANLPGGDADSQGWRQERASIYSNPRDLNASINRAYDEMDAVHDKYATAGSLAAAIQRPAAAYRGRYQQRSAQADALLGGQGASPAGAARRATTGGTKTTTATTTFDQAGFDKARKLTILGNYLATKNPNSPLVTLGVASPGALPDKADFTQTSTSTKTTPLTTHVTSRGYSDTTAGLLQTLTSRADKIDSKHFKYAWGGGHAGKAPAGSIPVDCSGAVSQVLGIDPRVASQFKNFGKPGKGRVTIYAKDTHVLMEINGHFFGTSASNPGGGAGWIKHSDISPEYLKGFTARHIDA